ncbi:ferredoxin reductase-like protein [Amylostereum chailletii]|nr:ferredoxin reductase-like protein [Amylostereum chailletii]
MNVPGALRFCRPLSYRNILRLRRAEFSRRLSSSKAHPPDSRTRVLANAVLIGAGGLVAAYLFWPSTYRGAPTVSRQSISPSHFTPVSVVANEDCGRDLKLLTLNIPSHSLPDTSDSRLLDPIWSLFIKDDDIQVERPYTPLEGIDDQGNMKFWIKKYPNGEVGRWLHSKQPGENVEMRGPLKTFPFHEELSDEIIMISGGTGFSPFYQLLHRVLLQGSMKGDSPRFTLLHGSRTLAELPPAQYLQPLLDFSAAHPERLRISLFVDDYADGKTAPSSHGLQQGRIDAQAIRKAINRTEDQTSWWSALRRSFSKEHGPSSGNVIVLVCGPEPMVVAVAGPYGRNYSQGRVGGILAGLGFKEGQVWKL